MIAAALDTSHGASLAVALADGRLVVQADLPARARASDRDLVPWLQASLGAAGLAVGEVRGWTLGTGPGSFSGVRSGIAVVKGICAVTGAAYRGLPSSLALARQGLEANAVPRLIGVLHDGRCRQVIVTRFRWTGLVLDGLGEAEAVFAEALAEPRLGCDCYVTCQGDLVLPMLAGPVRERTLCVPTPAARWLLDPAGWGWPADAGTAEVSTEPVYVRPPVFVMPSPPGPVVPS